MHQFTTIFFLKWCQLQSEVHCTIIIFFNLISFKRLKSQITFLWWKNIWGWESECGTREDTFMHRVLKNVTSTVVSNVVHRRCRQFWIGVSCLTLTYMYYHNINSNEKTINQYLPIYHLDGFIAHIQRSRIFLCYCIHQSCFKLVLWSNDLP